MSDHVAWMCLMVNGAFGHGDAGAVEREVSSVFGEDLLGSKTVCNEEMKRSTGEYYLFVRCRNWAEHTERLAKSAAVVSAVPSLDSPHEFTEAEIKAFAGSTVEKKPGELRRGDMVLVKEGYLKNLYGVVDAHTSPKRCRVAFSFHLRKFSESIQVTWLKKVANIFERRRLPPSGKESGKIGTAHRDIRGEKSREHAGRAGG